MFFLLYHLYSFPQKTEKIPQVRVLASEMGDGTGSRWGEGEENQVFCHSPVCDGLPSPPPRPRPPTHTLEGIGL